MDQFKVSYTDPTGNKIFVGTAPNGNINFKVRVNEDKNWPEFTGSFDPISNKLLDLKQIRDNINYTVAERTPTFKNIEKILKIQIGTPQSVRDNQIARWKQGYERYEKIRKLNAENFKQLFKKALEENKRFDDLVDEL